MSKELYDLVDENDQVIGTTDKATSHTTGQLHRVAAVFVFNQKGELYIQVHKSDGKWDHSVGGHVTKGETYAQAAKREAHEELGITQPLTELAVSIAGPEYPHMQHFFGLYECVADPDWQFVPNEEVPNVFAMPFDEVRKAMKTEPEDRFTRGFRITMAKYLDVKGIK